MQILVIQLLAIAVVVCSTWVLQLAWRAAQRNWLLVVLGWALGLASLYIWTFTTAADKGVALGVTAWVIVALLFLLAAALKSPVRQRRSIKKKVVKHHQGGGNSITKKQVLGNTLTALIVGPLAGLAAMAVSTLMLVSMQALKVEYTANLTIASIFFPLCWGALAVLLTYQQRLLIRLNTSLGICIASFVCLIVIT